METLLDSQRFSEQEKYKLMNLYFNLKKMCKHQSSFQSFLPQSVFLVLKLIMSSYHKTSSLVTRLDSIQLIAYFFFHYFI